MNEENKTTLGEEILNFPNGNNEKAIIQYDNLVINHYLKKKLYFYGKKEEEHIFELYSQLFSSIITPSVPGFTNKTGCDSLFLRIKDKIENSQNVIPIIVKSRAGHGKTEFLSVLYQFLKRQYKNSTFNSFPIYISLHHYNKTIYKSAKRFNKQAKEALCSDISPLLNHLKESSSYNKVLLIIDGPDEFRYQKVEELEEKLFEILNGEIPNNLKIIGLRQYVDKNKISIRNQKNIDAEIELQIDKISVTDSKFNQFIKDFVEIEKLLGLVSKNAKLEEYIHNNIKQLSMKHIDMFHLFLLSKSYNNYGYSGIANIGGLYEQYIKKCDIDLNDISLLAFKMYNQPGNITNDEKNTKIWWKLQKHDSLRAFLAAYYIANTLINYFSTEIPAQDTSVFNYVYPYEINSYCKDIINEDKETESSAYESIMKLYKNSTITARTHFAYLLGRLRDSELKKNATKFLLQEESSNFEKVNAKIQSIEYTQRSSKPDRQLLLYYRTICISLICLGNNDISTKYIKQMLQNKYMDKLNRGFHLEYYEDITLPLTPQAHLLMHDDDLCEFPKTYNRLFFKISDAVYNNNLYPLFYVELYTLCSLIQHRLENGLYISTIDTVINVIDKILNSNIALQKDLKEYLYLCNVHFRYKKDFCVSSFVKELYFLKQLKRKGWIERNINAPETVASHSWGTLLLAYIFLPTILVDDKEYDKDLIIRMLIVHDMGEAYIGDLTPNEKGQKERDLETICFNYISLMGSYTFINSAGINELFNMFTFGHDINSCIARDLDKLDNLLQLHIYRSELSETNFNDFKRSLKESIKTDIGKQIEEQIYKMFDTQCSGIEVLIEKYKK